MHSREVDVVGSLVVVEVDGGRVPTEVVTLGAGTMTTVGVAAGLPSTGMTTVGGTCEDTVADGGTAIVGEGVRTVVLRSSFRTTKITVSTIAATTRTMAKSPNLFGVHVSPVCEVGLSPPSSPDSALLLSAMSLGIRDEYPLFAYPYDLPDDN